MSHCSNGGCRQPVYRGKYCFRCWAGVKWTSIVQRLENKMGNCNSYVGIPLGFTRETLIHWVLENPPPKDMKIPSIDRIKGALGYVPGNIRWLERDRNSAGPNRDVPIGLRPCRKCGNTYPLTATFFVRNGGKNIPFSHYCRACNRVYQREWEKRRAASI